jgi:hypothetical protein
MSEVTSVNGQTGAVVLTAADVEAVPTSAEGQPSGVATLDGGGVLQEAQVPGSVVSSNHEPAEPEEIAVSENAVSRAVKWIKASLFAKKADLKIWGPWHMVRDFGAVPDLQRFAKCSTASGSNIVEVVSAQASWVGKQICEELAGSIFPRGTTVTAAVNGGKTITVSNPAVAEREEIVLNIFTDNSPMAEAAVTAAIANIRIPPAAAGADGDPVFMNSIEWGPGMFGFADANAFLNIQHGVCHGLKMVGSSNGATVMFFAPSTENAYFSRNIQSVYDWTLADFLFFCNDPTASFHFSLGPPNNFYRFHRCKWDGTWKHMGLDLAGPNDNSDHKWDECAFAGKFTTGAIHSPPEGSVTTAEVAAGATVIPVVNSTNYTVGQVIWFCTEATGEAAVSNVESRAILAIPDETHIEVAALTNKHVVGTFVSGGSDQYLNYEFENCQGQYAEGNLVDMSSGGGIVWKGGGLIHKGNGENEDIFFALRGSTHGTGVCRLKVSDARLEERHIRSKFLYCEWEQGLIEVSGCDWSTVNPSLPTSTEIKTTLTAEAKAGEKLLVVAASGGTHPFTVGMQIVILSGEYAEGRVITAIPDGTHIEVNAPLAIAHTNGGEVRQATRPYLNPVLIKFPHSIIVEFKNCALNGRHYWGFGNTSYLYGRSFTYTRCRLVDWENPDEFILSVANREGVTFGDKAPVKFIDCTNNIGGGGNAYEINGTVNGQQVGGTRCELHTLRFKTSEGKAIQSSGGGTASLERSISKNAVITAVRFKHIAGGAKTNKNWVYKLLDLSNAEAVIAKVEGGGAIEWKSAWELKEALNLHMTGEATSRWKLKLVCENVEEAGTFTTTWFEVDYIA